MPHIDKYNIQSSYLYEM